MMHSITLEYATCINMAFEMPDDAELGRCMRHIFMYMSKSRRNANTPIPTDDDEIVNSFVEDICSMIRACTLKHMKQSKTNTENINKRWNKGVEKSTPKEKKKEQPEPEPESAPQPQKPVQTIRPSDGVEREPTGDERIDRFNKIYNSLKEEHYIYRIEHDNALQFFIENNWQFRDRPIVSDEDIRTLIKLQERKEVQKELFDSLCRRCPDILPFSVVYDVAKNYELKNGVYYLYNSSGPVRGKEWTERIDAFNDAYDSLMLIYKNVYKNKHTKS